MGSEITSEEVCRHGEYEELCQICGEEWAEEQKAIMAEQRYDR